ncbi:MAG: diguanylate cyclase [Betaproteobacteria bacterium]|nr:diguanylate cyclase [Betaproteobacteria bacterium]MDE2209389.1 diguanylate cyclase [Betaproteobacteria bacterium]MDE2359756.1 diguanylate cyclase [Betaproteobacteria bacterium]
MSAMIDNARSVLVIGSDPVAAAAIREALSQPGEHSPAAVWAQTLSDGVARLGDGGIDAILLDPALPDSQGIDSFDEIFLAARDVPILVLTTREGEEVGRQALQRGAKERVLKEHIGGYSLGLMLRHMKERAAVDDALLSARQRAQAILDSIGDGVISIDREGRVTYLNPAAERMTGWSRDEANGRMLSEVFRIVDGDTRQPARNPMELPVRQDRTASLPHNSVLVHRHGIEFPIEDSIAPIHEPGGQVAGAVMVFRDVSKARQLEVELTHLARHDFLTGLPNRMLLNDRLDQAIALARRYGRRVAVLFLDLDGFKHINDSLGHAIGDRLLQKTGKRLAATVRASDTVSRQGGDEFVVVLSEIEHAQNAARQAEKIHAALAKPHAIAGHDLQVNASIGISVFPDDGQDAEALIKCADTAMYHAKENGRNTYEFFRPEMVSRVVARQSRDAHSRQALERPEFALHCQSKSTLNEDRPVARARHDDGPR